MKKWLVQKRWKWIFWRRLLLSEMMSNIIKISIKYKKKRIKMFYLILNFIENLHLSESRFSLAKWILESRIIKMKIKQNIQWRWEKLSKMLYWNKNSENFDFFFLKFYRTVRTFNNWYLSAVTRSSLRMHEL